MRVCGKKMIARVIRRCTRQDTELGSNRAGPTLPLLYHVWPDDQITGSSILYILLSLLARVRFTPGAATKQISIMERPNRARLAHERGRRPRQETVSATQHRELGISLSRSVSLDASRARSRQTLKNTDNVRLKVHANRHNRATAIVRGAGGSPAHT